MKQLLLIRHAKAIHDNSYDDYERPLKHSGIEDATLMAERVKSEAHVPQILITSPSLRTLSTANIFAEHLSLPKPAEDKRIYEASLQSLVRVINEFPDNHDFIGFVGHNPGIAELLHYFTREFRDVSPGTSALILFDVDEWQMITHDSGKITWYSSPKDS